jgi:hypothetical protein
MVLQLLEAPRNEIPLSAASLDAADTWYGNESPPGANPRPVNVRVATLSSLLSLDILT